MSTAITPIAWASETSPVSTLTAEPAGVAGGDFAALLNTGVSGLDAQTRQASDLLSAYAVGDNVAPHDLVMAMEQAQLSLQLAVEVRNRLVDAYQELTRLQI